MLERFPGAALDGVRYEAPFPFLSGREWGERGHTVLLADFVSADDGTGLVHTAIAFGEDDFRLGERYGLNVVNPVLPDGTYDERIGKYAGRYVKDADPDLIEDLKRRGRVLRAEELEHSYPHCWRSGNPLIYYAKPTWYIATSTLRDRLVAANEEVSWHPEHIKHGRFGDWLAGNVDWALSRERYWGTPLPVWRDEDGNVTVIGSFAELEELSGVQGHRPAPPLRRRHRVPEPASRARPRAACPRSSTCGSTPGRCRSRSGTRRSRTRSAFEEQYPADFVCEAIDQTRGWFYSLHAISVLLNDQPTYRNVVCLGLILDGEGQKMSKSKGNIVVPWDVIDRFGADAFRWYFFTSKQPWDGYRFSMDAIGEGVRLFLRQLWNVYAFYARYAPFGEQSDGGRDRPGPLDPLAGRRDGRGGHRAAGRLRRDVRRPRDRRARRRPLQLVRPPLAAALLGRRRERAADAARGARHRVPAARAVHAVHRRRDLREPRRLRAVRAPHRLARAAGARPRARARHARRARGGDARPACARRGEGEAAPAAARGGRRRRGRRARRDRAPRGRRARRAQREGACGWWAPPTSSATSSSSPTTARSVRGSASRCRRSQRRSRRSTPPAWPSRCARAARSP